jgi:hypothetical protein
MPAGQDDRRVIEFGPRRIQRIGLCEHPAEAVRGKVDHGRGMGLTLSSPSKMIELTVAAKMLLCNKFNYLRHGLLNVR